MKKSYLIIILIIVFVFLFKGYFSTNIMELPMKAASIQEYNRSMIEISKKIKNPNLKYEFLDALTEVAYGPDQALIYEFGEGLVYLNRDIMLQLCKKCDGKTPNEIIEMANEERKIKLSIRFYSNDKDKMDEITNKYEVIKIDDNIHLLPGTKKTIHQPPDPKIRRSDSIKATIEHNLIYLRTDIRNWRNINDLPPDAIPTTGDMIQFLGEDRMMPSNFDMQFIILSNGEPACLYKGKTYTSNSKELNDPDYIIN